jgi:hypothetical protein
MLLKFIRVVACVSIHSFLLLDSVLLYRSAMFCLFTHHLDIYLFIVSVVLVFEFGVSHLLGRCFTT